MYIYSYDIRFYIEFFFLSLSQLYIESELTFLFKERNRKKRKYNFVEQIDEMFSIRLLYE